MLKVICNIRIYGGGDVEILRVSFEQKIILRNLMELYQYDMSQYEDECDSDVNEYGLYDYKYLDHYWTEEGRHPFFVMKSGKLAGFVLVREIKVADTTSKYSVAEFFILRKYRRQGIGREVAYKVFEMFKPGRGQRLWDGNSRPRAVWK